MASSFSPKQNLRFEACACAALREASRSVSHLYDLVMEPTGLKITQFIILKTLFEAGELAQCDFARAHAIAVETLSRRFGGLRKKGYVQLRIGAPHGERIYSLTEKGIEAFQNAMPYWERAQDRLRTALGETGWLGLMEIAEKIRRASVQAEQLRTENQPRAGAVTSMPARAVGN